MHTLTLVEGPGAPKTFVLEHRVTIAGRGLANDIVLDGLKVSKRHVLFCVHNDESVLVEDLNSRNGLYVEEQRVTETQLQPGASVRIGECRLQYARAETHGSDSSIPELPEIETGYRVFIADAHGTFDVVPLKTECVYLGKVEDNDIVLPGPDVSRRHAMLCLSKGRWQIHDLESTNGTHVDGQAIEQAELAPGERIRIGGFLLALDSAKSPVSRDELVAEAARQLKKPDSYLAWSTQIRLLVGLLGVVLALVVVVLLRLTGKL